MLILENVSLAIASIKASKMRSLLTMLGIIIGISSVIAIVSIGDSISTYMENSFKDMGLQNINVYVSQKDPDNYAAYGNGPDREVAFRDDQLKEFKENYKEYVQYTGVKEDAGAGDIRVGRKDNRIRLNGVNGDAMAQEDINIVEGRRILDSDIEKNRSVAIIPDKIAKKIKGQDGEILGQEIKVKVNELIETFIIVGVYMPKKDGGLFGGFVPMDSMYIPYSKAMKISQSKGIFSFEITPAYGQKNEEVVSKIHEFFDRYYEKNPIWEIGTDNMQNQLEAMSDILRKIKLAIAVIAGISLLVGGIGVMNIMLVSVTERTREIGIRKALGAKKGHIKLQFIIEAIIICCIGGLIGVTFGLSISWVISNLINMSMELSITPVLISVIFSMSIGVFFGYYPASKAAKLDPIEALRYE